MKFGIYSWFGFVLPLEERLRLIGEAGFTATCLWFGHEEEMVAAGRMEEMPNLVRGLGLYLDNIHAPFHEMYRLWSGEAADRDAVRRELAEALDFCGRHRIPTMVIHSEGGDRRLPPSENGLEVMHDLVAKAERLGVTVAVENVHDDGYLDFLFGAIDSPRLGFCYDSGHEVLSGKSGRLLRKWGNRLVTTHFSDTLGKTDDHFLPGRGNIDWGTLIQALVRTGYKGVLMLEVDGPESAAGYATAADFLADAYASLLQLAV